MKLKYLALAAAVAFSTPALAAPVPAPGSTFNQSLKSFFEPLGSTWASVLAPGKYFGSWSESAVSTVPMTPVSAISTVAYDWILTVTAPVSGLVSASGVETFKTSTAFYIGGIQLGSIGGPSGSGYQVNASANVAAVPGPEAGAGLGALAMGGIALYLKRRRKEEALAA